MIIFCSFTSAFMYYLEDVFVSLMLWSCGYKCVFLPVMVGEHLRGAPSGNNLKSLELLRYSFRNHIALLYITNSAEKKRYILHYLRWAVLSSGTFAWRQTVLKGMIEGLRIGKQLQRKYGTINLYETPMLRTPLRDRFYL